MSRWGYAFIPFLNVKTKGGGKIIAYFRIQILRHCCLLSLAYCGTQWLCVKSLSFFFSWGFDCQKGCAVPPLIQCFFLKEEMRVFWHVLPLWPLWPMADYLPCFSVILVEAARMDPSWSTGYKKVLWKITSDLCYFVCNQLFLFFFHDKFSIINPNPPKILQTISLLRTKLYYLICCQCLELAWIDLPWVATIN